MAVVEVVIVVLVVERVVVVVVVAVLTEKILKSKFLRSCKNPRTIVCSDRLGRN